MRLQLAFRNLLRHRLRTILSCMMVAFSVTGIITFKGFANYNIYIMAKALGEEQYGHVQVATQEYWDRSVKSAKEKLLSNSEELSRKIEALPGVQSASGRLTIFGLMNFNDNSQATAITGFDPDTEPGLRKHLHIFQGDFFKSATGKEILISVPLAKAMEIKPGDEVTILNSTLDGAFNGMDLTVTGIYATGIQEVDAYNVFLPLKTLQTLYETDKVDLLTVRGPNLDSAANVVKSLQPLLAKAPQKLIAKPWYDLSELYQQVVNFYSVQNKVIELIILTLIFLGVTNIVGMSIIERTGEIGTIRSLGETRGSLLKQFITESLILGTIGTLIGFAIAIAAAKGLDHSTMTMDIPGASVPIPVRIHLVPYAFFYAYVVTQLATIIATLIPGARATRINIVEALRKNI